MFEDRQLRVHARAEAGDSEQTSATNEVLGPFRSCDSQAKNHEIDRVSEDEVQ